MRLLAISLFVSATGCFKPGATLQAEQLAKEINARPGCTQQLRSWYSEISAFPGESGKSPLTIPAALIDPWTKGARANGTWSADGRLVMITVVREPWESWVVIGPPQCKLDDVELTQKPGEPPVFYAVVTNGIFTFTPYYH